jgi:hypothetical protein
VRPNGPLGGLWCLENDTHSMLWRNISPSSGWKSGTSKKPGTNCLHLQADASLPAASALLIGLPFDVKMEAICVSETGCELHGVTSQATILFIVAAVRTSNPALNLATQKLPCTSRDSSVGIATGWTAGVRFPAGVRDFNILHSV